MYNNIACKSIYSVIKSESAQKAVNRIVDMRSL